MASHWDCKRFQPVSIPMDLLGRWLWCVCGKRKCSDPTSSLLQRLLCNCYRLYETLPPPKATVSSAVTLLSWGSVLPTAWNCPPKFPFSPHWGKSVFSEHLQELRYFWQWRGIPALQEYAASGGGGLQLFCSSSQLMRVKNHRRKSQVKRHLAGSVVVTEAKYMPTPIPQQLHSWGCTRQTPTETCARMFIASLFMIAKSWKLRKYPRTVERIDKLWHIFTRWNNNSVIRINDLQVNAATWTNVNR